MRQRFKGPVYSKYTLYFFEYTDPLNSILTP